MPPVVYLLLGLAIGSAIGSVIGWLWAWKRAAPSAGSPVETELRQMLAHSQRDSQQQREQLISSAAAAAASDTGRQNSEKALLELREAHEAHRREASEQLAKSLTDLREAFKALSVDALRETQPEFLRLANETLAKFQETAKGDLSRRQEAIATLVKPLEEQLKTYQQRLAQSESMQSSALGEVKNHLAALAQQSQSLSTETLQLRKILNSNQARGRWGEETLRRVVEAAGLSAHCDFTEQAQAGEGKPDLLIHLPGDRVIVVDAKVPDLDFLCAIDQADSQKRSEILALHASKLKTTIKSLADRGYPSQLTNALDYVILFLPAESLFSAALEGDSEIIVWAAGKKILLATPASLIAILRSVAVSWRQYAQNANAEAIAEAAQELFNRVVKFAEHFEKIGAGLDRANNAFNEARASYDARIRPSGNRLLRLSTGSTNQTPQLPGFESTRIDSPP